MTGPSRLEQEAALRRALTRSSSHGHESVVHTRTRERINAATRIHVACQRPETDGAID